MNKALLIKLGLQLSQSHSFSKVPSKLWMIDLPLMGGLHTNYWMKNFPLIVGYTQTIG